MKLAVIALIAVLGVTPAAAHAQGRTPLPNPVETAPVAGATVYDGTGAIVGTIASVTGPVAVIDTGSTKIGYPLSAIGPGAKGPTIALSRAQLEAGAAEQAAKTAADLTTQLVAGTAVRSRNGAVNVGTIKAVDDEFVTMTTAKGDLRFPKSGFLLGPQGVIVSLTAEEFDKAIGAY